MQQENNYLAACISAMIAFNFKFKDTENRGICYIERHFPSDLKKLPELQ